MVKKKINPIFSFSIIFLIEKKKLSIIGTCEELCGQLPNEIEQYACTIICAYVGIELFVEVIQYEDPDPIFICQEFDMCPVVNGGEIVINKTSVVPPAGKVGTTFDLSMIYVTFLFSKNLFIQISFDLKDVINATGPGYIAVAIQGPDDSYPITSGVFTEGQNPGIYSARWQVQAEPSETEDFARIILYLCFSFFSLLTFFLEII